MAAAVEMQNLLLVPLDALISHSAKRQSGVWGVSVNRSQVRSDHSRHGSVHGGTRT